MSENIDVTMKTEEETVDGEDVIEDNEKSVNKKLNKKSNNIPITSSTTNTENNDNNDKKTVTTNETTPTTVPTSSTTQTSSTNTTTNNNNTTNTISTPSTTTTNTLNSNTDTTSSTTSNTTTIAATPTILPKKRTKQEVIVEIEELMSEKKNIENKLASLEKQIYALEGRYLEDTHHVGNVIRGFDSYISGSGALKKLRWKESDRLFSTSSSTYLNSISDRNEIVEQDNSIKKKRDKGKLSSSSSNPSKKN
ncbi:hypothetical protein ACTFIU_007910 [Dictyostelium citrinum]